MRDAAELVASTAPGDVTLADELGQRLATVAQHEIESERLPKRLGRVRRAMARQPQHALVHHRERHLGSR